MGLVNVGRRAVLLTAVGILLCGGSIAFAGEETRQVSNEELLKQMRALREQFAAQQMELQAMRAKLKTLEGDRANWEARDTRAVRTAFNRGLRTVFADLVDNGGGSVNNVTAPKSKKLRFSGQLRTRAEFSDNLKTFDNRNKDGSQFTQMRTRLQADFNVEKNVDARIQIQDSRFFGEEPMANGKPNGNGNLARLDLKQGFVRFSNVVDGNLNLFGGEQRVDVQVGRQTLSLGQQRLVGAFEWDNYGRAFDGLLLNIKPRDPKDQTWDVKAFGFKLYENFGPSRTQAGAALAAHGVDNDTDLVGVYGSIRPIKKSPKALVLEPYVIHLNNRTTVISEGGRDPQQITTYGLRGEIKPDENFLSFLEGFAFDWEWAMQTGNNGTADHMAYALHTALSYQVAEDCWDWKPKFLVEYNWASGDRDPTDNTSDAFINLVPTNHGKYGYMDLVSWSNMHNVRAGATVYPRKNLDVSLDLHWFWLDEKADGLRFAGNTLPGSGAASSNVAPNAAGNSDEIGQELDLRIRCKASKSVRLEAGYSHFFTGRFIEQSTGGRNDADWGYLQATVDF